jgi:hypothetical protein
MSVAPPYGHRSGKTTAARGTSSSNYVNVSQHGAIILFGLAGISASMQMCGVSEVFHQRQLQQP